MAISIQPLLIVIVICLVSVAKIDAFPFITRRERTTSKKFPLRHQHGFLLTPMAAASRRKGNGWDTDTIVMPDYLIVDSQDLINRPSISSFLQRPRESIPMALMVAAITFSVMNILGKYNESYLSVLYMSVFLGLVTAIMDLYSTFPPYDKLPTEGVSPNIRLGVVDDALLHLYSGVYTSCASWLALRTCPICPSELIGLDPLIGPLALGIFWFSLMAPVLTLLCHYTGIFEGPVHTMVMTVRKESHNPGQLPSLPQQLTNTELVRARGLLAIGVIACTYAPIVISFLVLGQDWWVRVGTLFPSQSWLESSTALFGVYATQASMIAHRAGKAGVAPFAFIVPAFALVCLFLSFVPCIAALYWLGDEISFVELYSA